ncbi:hypothetical protein LX83_005524 [Goodfellowiella coeruleoviolacea]|uniref:Uncharacterized protein n=1 Tax=Goodfellowiella coeruleoviolacea TaxID=334858 RepID=A0AAE3GI45_9PSEU|nr:hypothetical protein [Goodfellowiella coeruleoviolacea]
MDGEQLYSIGELAWRTGVSVQAIRFCSGHDGARPRYPPLTLAGAPGPGWSRRADRSDRSDR